MLENYKFSEILQVFEDYIDNFPAPSISFADVYDREELEEYSQALEAAIRAEKRMIDLCDDLGIEYDIL